MTVGAAARVAGLVFVVALVQGTIVSSVGVASGTADLLLVSVIAIGLVRGSVVGAVAGFWGGIVLDLLTLDTLGITSLVLTLAGFWAGRYAETSPNSGRRFAPLLAVAVLAPLAAIFGFAVHYMLGDEIVARYALVTSLLPSVALDLLIALPVYALVRRVVRAPESVERMSEVEVVV